MNGEERLLRIIGEIGDEFVQEAEQEKPVVRNSRKGWIAAAAACLCLLILWQSGAVLFSHTGGDSESAHFWKEEFPPPEVFFEGLVSAGEPGEEDAPPSNEEHPVPGAETVVSAQIDQSNRQESHTQVPIQTDVESIRDEVDTTHIWKEGFSPESYFVGSSGTESAIGGGDLLGNSASSLPAEEEPKITSLKEKWKELERKGWIPSLIGWNEYAGILTEEENRVKVWIQWLRTDSASPLCLSVELSSGEGQKVKQEGVLNQRDGVFIFASGTEESSKQLSYERDGIVTTITGSNQVTYQEMVEVLDWYWAHPGTLEQICEWVG